MPSRPRPFRSERGSLLIVAMLLCAVIGISIVSYIRLSRSSLTISNRALYNNAAMNLAENGLEEAMYGINQLVADDTYAWPGWTNNGTTATSDAWTKWTGFTFDQNATGVVRTIVYNYKGLNAPKIVARATITLGSSDALPIEKWVEVTLKKTSKFASGLVAKNSVIFNGTNTSVDSWNSASGGAGTYSPYSAASRKDNGSVGSISVGVDAVLVKQADIWGYVSTGGTDPTSAVGSGGSVLGAGSTYDPSTWTKSTVDPTRVSTDFSASFDPVSAPTKTYLTVPGGTINGDTTLPLAADVAAGKADADGNYYYTADQVNLTNKVLTVTGKVVLKLTNTTTAVDVGGGSGAINVTTGTLAVYGDGDVKIAGQGVSNGVDGADSGTDLKDSELNAPANFQFWGTKTSGAQDIKVAGNGAFSGVIYAPQGNVTINGNGSVAGSVVANNITLTGNANFHYDESLGDFGGGNPFRVSKWKELTLSTDRDSYRSSLSF